MQKLPNCQKNPPCNCRRNCRRNLERKKRHWNNWKKNFLYNSSNNWQKKSQKDFKDFFQGNWKLSKESLMQLPKKLPEKFRKKKLTEIIEKTSYIIPKIIGKRTPWRIFKEFVKKFFNLRLPLRLWVLWYSRLIVFVSFLLLFFILLVF